MNLICACCGEKAPAKKQWWNRDTGYGICPACFQRVSAREGREAALLEAVQPEVPHV